MPKKNDCNIVTTWPYHVILLVFISNNISLNLLIAFTYYHICIGLYSWDIKLYLSIMRN